MFYSRAMEYRINRIHERALSLIYPNQNQLTLKDYLEKKTVSIEVQNSRVTKSNYEIELRKMTSHFE